MGLTTLNSVNDNYDGFQKLITFLEKYRFCQYESINIHLSSFFSANMSAPLGAILDLLSTRNNIALHSDPAIQTILQKNGFLSYYGHPSVWDNNNTTIQYMRFKRSESNLFAQYVSTRLLDHPELPNFTTKAKAAISTVILEIFTNAVLHTQTEYIYTCGQFYPNKHCIDFSIADTGLGICETINSRIGGKMDAKQAIEWALVDGHTTKQGVPGGYGLTILQNFLHFNKGGLQIISNNGYYSDINNQKNYRSFNADFPGTVLNLQIKTDDNNLYRLINE